ncbi:hypothetical protein C161_27423 [Paenibacillus sp. FSL R5-192]|uniref:hypothetical protein n=1 Tax=Paenibacillus sp. FSL R5-192 TaxID=1226754 RepID=UPI0003E2C697|nr:hypothetical protein [Paenibacillus sp. FSL R5-192]ETT30707.1 hypothetical protein C161_27423 [Paenibacillus sp. FSL R5-192]
MNLDYDSKISLLRITLGYLEKELDRKKNEVEMLKHMHQNISKLGADLESVLISNKLATKLTMNSYFIHATPKVTYDGISKKRPGGIEFGDVLYIYTEGDKQNKIRENALLYQAKLFSSSKVDEHQLKLYTKWSPFSLLKEKNRKYVLNTNSNPHPGARYLLLDTSTLNTNFASTMTPEDNLRANRNDSYLEHDLVGLLDFSRGKELAGEWGEAINKVRDEIITNNLSKSGFVKNQSLSLVSEGQDNNLNEEIMKNVDVKGFWLIHIVSEVSNTVD